RESADFANRGRGDHRDARFVEDATVEVHHLDRRTEQATDLRRQFIAENIQLLAFRRANVSGEVAVAGGPGPLWGKENQPGKCGGAQPGEAAAIVSPTERQAPVTLDTVPAQVGDLEKFAAHGLDWVPEERRYFTNFDRHVGCRPPNVFVAQRRRLGAVPCCGWLGAEQ